jgi:hypothetical protein
MPTKRMRRGHAAALSLEIIATLGMGAGINSMNADELKALWREYGERVTDYWRRQYGEGEEPFVAMLAREEGWDDAD